MPVTQGVFFGIGMGVFLYWALPWPLGATARGVGAGTGAVVCGVLFGIMMAVSRSADGWWRIRPVSGLPPSDRVAVLRAVRGGEAVSDPRLAPGVLAYAEWVMAFVHKQQDRHEQRRLFVLVVFALVMAVSETVTGRVGLAVFFGTGAAMFLIVAWRLPGSLEHRRAKAQAAADSAAGQIGR